MLSRWLIVVAAAYLAFVLMPMTNAHGWRGGWSPAARFLVPVVPLAAVALAMVGAAKIGRRVAAGLVALQVLIDLLLWSRPMLMWSEGPGPSPLLLTIAGDVANRLPPIDGVHPAAIGLAVAWSSLAALLTWIIVRGEPTSSDLS